MRLVLQRVKRASVTVDEEVVGEIGKGMLVLVGIHRDDVAEDAAWCRAVHKSNVATCTPSKRHLLDESRDLHAIDAAPARRRGDAGSSPLDGMHPTHWLISTQPLTTASSSQ